ncbi:MAG: hypothetical protein WDO73_28810 [Ignavibacteriota bacterium]
MRRVAPAEHDLAILQRHQLVIRDGDTMGVTSEIAECVLGPTERALGRDHPIGAEQPAQNAAGAANPNRLPRNPSAAPNFPETPAENADRHPPAGAMQWTFAMPVSSHGRASPAPSEKRSGAYVRTNWAGRSLVRTARSIFDYDAVFDPIRAARAARSGNRRAIRQRRASHRFRWLNRQIRPLTYCAGGMCWSTLQKELDGLNEELAKWESLTRSTNFDQAVPRGCAPKPGPLTTSKWNC